MDVQEKKVFDAYFKEKYPELYKDVFDEDGDDRAIIGYSFAWSAWRAAKTQAVPKWISVKDKLPSDDIGRVLAWVVEQNSLGKCGFVWNCSHSNGVFSDKFETFQVTHWMPLPDAPQEPAND